LRARGRVEKAGAKPLALKKYQKDRGEKKLVITVNNLKGKANGLSGRTKVADGGN